MIRRPPRSTQSRSSAASDVYKRQVCLSAAARPHYCTHPDVSWSSGRGCPLVVHYWADLQSVHGLRCYGNITTTSSGTWTNSDDQEQWVYSWTNSLKTQGANPVTVRPHPVNYPVSYNANAKCYRVHACTRSMPSLVMSATLRVHRSFDTQSISHPSPF